MNIVRNLLALGVCLTLLAPAFAQQAEPARSKPTLKTYDQAPPAQAVPIPPVEQTEANPANQTDTRPDLRTPPRQYEDTSNVPEEEKDKGDKDVLPTYNKEADPKGDKQDLPANTYDKKPNPAGDAQKLDATRYEENNEANDGKESQLEIRSESNGD